ncbi:MAG: GAF domain-containing protein [Acutalibacter sp.]|nr:GAF domain-containing protein [Acutalibacter sp.]
MKTDYSFLLKQARALTEGVRHPVPNLANLSALLWQSLPDINWAGFYFTAKGELLLGPFQGKPACVRIPWGKGVCGTAAQRAETLLVPDVHLFPGHIACDSASRSEVVAPILTAGQVVGVLDIDSPLPSRFTEEDAQGLTQLAALAGEACDWLLISGAQGAAK